MVYSRETAAKNAEKSTTNVPGTCQMWTRLKYDAPSAGDRDHDGDADAVDGWKSETKVHPGDRNPPRGVPVAFSGGSKGYGHRAISLGVGKIRSTDMSSSGYRAGHVGTTTIAQIERSMGVKYLGWSETITGIKIPTASSTPAPPKPPVQQTSFVIDLSHWQFDNGFKLKMAWDQGYRHVILKCTQGTSYVDPAYSDALAQAKKLGFKVSVYHFLEHNNAVAQAKNLHFHIIDKGLPVWIDVEPTREGKSDESLPTLRDWIIFRDEAKRLGLRVVGKYLTESYWERLRKPSLVGPLDLWRAAYPTPTRGYASKLYPGNNHARWNSFGGQKPSLWQFTQNAKIDGYSKGVDVSAYRGSHADLDREGWFKKVGETKPAPAPKPTPPPTPKPSIKSKDFVVHLVPSNKFSKGDRIAKTKADMALVKKLTGGNSGIVFNTERDTAELRQAVADGLGPDWTTVFKNECQMAYGSNWTEVKERQRVILAKEDPSMVGVSPTRVLNEIFVENKYLKGVPIAQLGTHLVSEPWCVHMNIKGKAWRQKTWKIQVNDIMTQLELLHGQGLPIVLAGDFNTGVKFNGNQLFAMLTARFGSKAVHVFNGSLDHIFLISTDKVKLEEVGKEVKTDNTSDHDMVTAKIRATVL